MNAIPLTDKWEKLFKEKPSVITDYSKQHIIHLEHMEMLHQDLSYSHIINAKFDNIKYDDDVFQNGSYTNTEFTGGTLNDTSFAGSVLTNVTFTNMTMTKAIFVGATLINVTFKNCKIYDSEFHNLEPSTFTIEDSELNRVNFFQSAMDLTLKNSRVIELGDFSGLVAGSKVTLDHSYIGPYSDFTFQKGLISFTAKNSDLKGFALGGTINSVVLDKSELDFTLGHSTINTLTVHACEITRLSHGDAPIKNIDISDCDHATLISFINLDFESMHIRNCNSSEIDLIQTTGNSLTIANSEFDDTEAESLKIAELTLQNVSFIGKMNFKGAVADKTAITGVTIAPTATLDMSGSNIPLKR